MRDLYVLLVDDEEEFVTTLSERLDLRGIRSAVAHDGETALRMVAGETPDVVVLDMMMPGLKGLEVLQRIKAEKPEVQVILLTGHGGARDGAAAMKLGAFDYLIKPLKIEDLLAKLAEAAQHIRRVGSASRGA